MYSCKHEIKPIFFKDNDIVWYSLYQQWKESGSKLCFDCWNKKRKEEFIKLSLDVLKKQKG